MATRAPATPGPSRARRTFAALTAAATFVLVIAGGLVTSTGSGLAVPDWPLSYGVLFPPMVGGILYEHGHRMIAGAVALLTAVLMVWTWRCDARRWVRWLSVAAFGTVVVQALLGGLTVILLLPTAVSVSHAGVAQLFFISVVTLALVTSDRWKRIEPVRADSTTLRRLTLFVLVLMFGQTLLGVWVRHTGSALAIPDFPLAYGGILPPLSADALQSVNRTLVYGMDLPRIESMSQVAIHLSHRIGALAVATAVVALFVATLRSVRREPMCVMLSVALLGLVVVQGTLGAFTIWTARSVPVATAHVAVGALTLATSAVYVLVYRRKVLPEPGTERLADRSVASPVAHEGGARA